MEEKKDFMTKITMIGQNNFGHLQFQMLEKLNKLYMNLNGDMTTLDCVLAKPRVYEENEAFMNRLFRHVKDVCSGGKLTTIKHDMDSWCGVLLSLTLEKLVKNAGHVVAYIDKIHSFDYLKGYSDNQKRYILVDRLLRTTIEEIHTTFWIKSDEENDGVLHNIANQSKRNETSMLSLLKEIEEHCKLILDIHQEILNKKINESIG